MRNRSCVSSCVFPYFSVGTKAFSTSKSFAAGVSSHSALDAPAFLINRRGTYDLAPSAVAGQPHTTAAGNPERSGGASPPTPVGTAPPRPVARLVAKSPPAESPTTTIFEGSMLRRTAFSLTQRKGPRDAAHASSMQPFTPAPELVRRYDGRGIRRRERRAIRTRRRPLNGVQRQRRLSENIIRQFVVMVYFHQARIHRCGRFRISLFDCRLVGRDEEALGTPSLIIARRMSLPNRKLPNASTGRDVSGPSRNGRPSST